MAAYAALVSLMNDLELIQNHPRHSFSFENKQIASLSQTVHFLIDFMESYDSHGCSREAVQVLESRIASAALAAHDVVESHVVDQIHAGTTLDGKPRSYFLLDLQKTIDNMGFVKRKAMQFEARSGIKAEQTTYSPPTSSQPLTSGKNCMVEFDAVLLRLMEMLTGEPSSLLVIPIEGMGGMGKTTLAKNAYDHLLIQHHFDVRCWATISQQYSVGGILKALVSGKRKSTVGNVNELGNQLHKMLWGRRYLIILDDMWSEDAWDEVQMFLPDNDNGSRVIVTTRLSNLATNLSPSPFKMNFLDEDESWKLFCGKAFEEEECPAELEGSGRRIVERCRGLPLSIAVIGGHLRKSSRAIEYWEMVAGFMNPVSSLDEDEKCMNVVEFGSLKKMEITELQSATSIWSHQTYSSLFVVELKVLVVVSCDTLRHLFSHSIAKSLVKLEHLIVDDCCTMQEVIADDSEAGEPELNESLFPRLTKLELRRLPVLKSFCNVMNDLELPSLEYLTLYDCQGMKEFSGGKLNTPVLRCVTKDSFTYRIDEGNYSIQHLFIEKPLSVHHSPLLGKYAFQEVEEIMEEGDMTEPIPSHLQMSSQASGDSDFDAKNVHLISRENTMKEENVAEFCSQDLGEKREEGASEFYFGTIDGREIEEMDDKMKSEVYIETLLNNKRDFILFCSVFPLNYEFTKDILVWQWIAAGLVELGEDEKIEEVCTECFDTLLGLHFIVPSGYDYSFDQMKYKIGDKMTTFFRSQLLEPKFGKYMDSEQSDPTKVEFLSMTLKEFNHVKSGVLELYSRLLTLVIHDCYEVNRLPSNLFLELKTLKTLNLSQTNIVYLPSSVGNLKELRFFDMSETPIVGLPRAICDVSHLQTLRLDGCLQLRGLPKDISKLINLRHLIIDVVHQLLYMPVGIGKLINLRTLTAFLVDERDGCNLRELKDMNKLRGSFCLLNLENVKTKEDASKACLYKKVHLRKIDLQWSDIRDKKAPHEEEILESLQPPLGIQELKILFYSGGVFPSWICNPSFSIVSLFLYKCRYCVSLPSLGELPSLKHLSVIENKEVVEIDSSFCRKQGNQNHAAFPKLEKLTFESMSRLERWMISSNMGDFPSLRHLIIEYCPEFVQLPNLLHFDSLFHLEIRYCPKLSPLPQDKLPRSLQSLMIKESVMLKEWCWNGRCSKIADVPTVYFDHEKFTWRM